MDSRASLRRRLMPFALALAALPSPLVAQGAVETIGAFQVRAAPVFADLIAGGGPQFDWMNTSNNQVDVDEAFSGVSVIADGFANAETGTILEVTFAAGMLVNGAGDDLVILDAHYSNNDYEISTGFDNFTAQLHLGVGGFHDTGVVRSYYVGTYGPYPIQVYAAAIDLSDLGVPGGQAVTSVRFRTLTWECDPLGMAALCPFVCDGGVPYCTAGTSSDGCVPYLSASGFASASGTTSFDVTAIFLPGQRTGLFLYGISGPLAQPWAPGSSSFLCVKTPAQRTPSKNSNGFPSTCGGLITFDWQAFQASHPNALGNPWIPGDSVWIQCWYRDPPAPKGTNLTDALQFPIWP